ncbi:hypothetical protein Tco_0266465 [Tanacetum coccineum]
MWGGAGETDGRPVPAAVATGELRAKVCAAVWTDARGARGELRYPERARGAGGGCAGVRGGWRDQCWGGQARGLEGRTRTGQRARGGEVLGGVAGGRRGDRRGGANFELEVPDEPKGKSIDTSKGHGLKPGVPDVSTTNSSESENESWGNSGDEADEQSDDKRTESDNEPTETDNPKTSYDEEETQDDEFVHTPEDYVPTDDERNDESNDVTEEEYERINEELYGDVNVSLTDVEPADKEKDDKEMTVVGHINVNQEGAVDTKVVSMLDINVQHEVPRTSPLLTIPVFVITEHNVINPPETVTTALAITISSLLTLLFPHLRQSTPILTPTTTEATTSTTAVSESKTLAYLRLRVTDLEKDVKELKDVDNSTKVISKIQFEVPKSVIEYPRSSLDDAMHKVI